MSYISNGRKRPKIRKRTTPSAAIVSAEEVVEIVEAVVDLEEEIVEVVDETCCDTAVEDEVVEETAEELDEVPLEVSEDEEDVVLDEEASLDGDKEEVDALVLEDSSEDEVAVLDEEVIEEVVEETAEEVIEEVVEETAEEVIEEVVEETAEEVIEEVVEETAEEVIEEVVEETAEEVIEEVAEETAEEVIEEVVEETAEEIIEEDADEDAEEVVEDVKAKKDEFKLTAPENLSELLSKMCTKRARKLIYRPADIIFAHTTKVLGTDKNNDEKIKIKNILDAEIKQGVKLGYLDKFDGLKMSEIKEEYENDIVYEYADQEFKRTGILLDGDKVKVYIYDWDMKACHHVGYIDDESAELVKPYILDSEKYSFDINGIIVGGKYKKVVKDEKTGKITVEKGNDGNLGLEIDINIINRKD